MNIFKKFQEWRKGKTVIRRVREAERILQILDITLQASGKNRAYRRRFWDNFVKVAVFGKGIR